MPRTTKPKPSPSPEPKPKPMTRNGSPGEMFTLSEAAAYLGFSEAEILRLVREQGLPARWLEQEWRFSRSAIQRWLAVSPPPGGTEKDAMLAFAGSWNVDPNLEDMVEEIYRQRGRPITEDGSYRLFQGLKAEDFQK